MACLTAAQPTELLEHSRVMVISDSRFPYDKKMEFWRITNTQITHTFRRIHFNQHESAQKVFEEHNETHFKDF